MPKSRCHTHRLAGPQARMLHRTNLPCSSKLAPDAPLPVSRIALGAHAQAASSILPSTKRARERDFCARVQYCALVALATINVQAGFLTARGHLTEYRYHQTASLLPNRVRNSPASESAQQKRTLVRLVQ
jgi:hypothetical protein